MCITLTAITITPSFLSSNRPRRVREYQSFIFATMHPATLVAIYLTLALAVANIDISSAQWDCDPSLPVGQQGCLPRQVCLDDHTYAVT